MATTTILRQDENSAVIQISGAAAETLTFVLNPGGATGPIGATGFANAISTGIVSVERIDWSITGTNKISLYFNGTSSDQLIGHFDGSGALDFLRDFHTKITNTAPSTDSTLLLTSTTADPYTIFLRVEKTSGFSKVGQYS